MAYVSLYRKYRSQSFSDLIGQNHVVKTLQNGITSGRIAHAYLFTGPRGTGKTSTARLLAKALCCEEGPLAEPCNACSLCKSITEGSCVDVYEMDAASEAGVDDVREAIVNASEYRPMAARFKVFIIDEVHDLSTKAFDALLKTIEEPPEHVIFILATTEYGKVPPTIRSRCQKHEFHRASMTDLVGRLGYVAKGEGIDIEPAALTAIARMADGGYRDALTVLEQVILTADGRIGVSEIYDQLGLVADEVVDRMLIALKDGDIGEIATLVHEVTRLGRDPRMILESMLFRLADMTRVAYNVKVDGATDVAGDAVLHDISTRLGVPAMIQIRSDLALAHKVIRDITLPRLWLESELIRISQTLRSPAPKPKQTEAIHKPEEPILSKPASQSMVEEPIRAKPQAEKVATKPPKVHKPKATGNPMIDEANVVWAKVKEELSKVSNLMAMRLGQSEVVGVDGNNVTIQFSRQMDADWVREGPKRQAAINETTRRLSGKEWVLEFTANSKPKSDNGEAETVEIPSEGTKLEQLTREIFSNKDTK